MRGSDLRPVCCRNPGMRERHWADISKNLGFDVYPDEALTLDRLIELRLGDFIDMIQKVAESAAKEYQIEQVREIALQLWATGGEAGEVCCACVCGVGNALTECAVLVSVG